jgi:hypothetical protein
MTDHIIETCPDCGGQLDSPETAKKIEELVGRLYDGQFFLYVSNHDGWDLKGEAWDKMNNAALAVTDDKFDYFWDLARAVIISEAVQLEVAGAKPIRMLNKKAQ